MFIGRKKGSLQDYITQIWVKTCGKKLLIKNNKWLFGPTGDLDFIGDEYISKLKKKFNLSSQKPDNKLGILDNFNAVHSELPHKKVVDFYENTINYKIDIKIKWLFIFKPFGWLLKILFSQRLKQLNIPLSQSAFNKGVKSEINKIYHDIEDIAPWTIWVRKSIELNEIIFSGIYTYCETPDLKTKIKVIFPLPNGSATVLFDTEIGPNGDFTLESKGSKIGESGFYFIVTKNKNENYVKMVKSMHEKLRVYVDNDNKLKALHEFIFWNITFLRLDYNMTRIN